MGLGRTLATGMLQQSHMRHFPDVPDVVRQRMSHIRKANTRPELIVRKAAHALGYRFRLHHRSLPGHPDIVFPRFRRVIFVHGCFWHRHGCKHTRPIPTVRTIYWRTKFERNIARHDEAVRQLAALGWSSIVIWECELKSIEALKERLRTYLEQPLSAQRPHSAATRRADARVPNPVPG